MGEEGKNSQAGGDVTHLLHALPAGEGELYEFVYSHLKAIAHNRLASEGAANGFQATDLVNEAYLKLASQNTAWRDRRHFYGVAAEAMRRILIDAARARLRVKRGGGASQEPLSGIALPAGEWEADVLDLHEALTTLENESPENAEIVRLRFFSGLTCEECAGILETSVSTIERRWRFARAWLRSRMK